MQVMGIILHFRVVSWRFVVKGWKHVHRFVPGSRRVQETYWAVVDLWEILHSHFVNCHLPNVVRFHIIIEAALLGPFWEFERNFVHRHRGSGVRNPHVVDPDICGLQVGSLRSVKVVKRLIHVQRHVPSPYIVSVVNIVGSCFLLLVVDLSRLNVSVQIRGQILRLSPFFHKLSRLPFDKVAILIDVIEVLSNRRRLSVNLDLW